MRLLPTIHTFHQSLEGMHWLEAIFKMFGSAFFEAFDVWGWILGFRSQNFVLHQKSIYPIVFVQGSIILWFFLNNDSHFGQLPKNCNLNSTKTFYRGHFRDNFMDNLDTVFIYYHHAIINKRCKICHPICRLWGWKNIWTMCEENRPFQGPFQGPFSGTISGTILRTIFGRYVKKTDRTVWKLSSN